MHPWYAKAVVLLASIVLVVIRAPHGQRSRSVKVARSWRGTVENVLLTIAWISFFLPLIWVFTPVFAGADFTLHPLALGSGTACLALGLWLFHRAHADLGTNWSITLEVREAHRLITHGIYQRIRHPMYLALLLYGLGQALVLPNWLAGPSYLVAMLLLVALRLGPEERMLRATFAAEYEAYAARTCRLFPGIF